MIQRWLARIREAGEPAGRLRLLRTVAVQFVVTASPLVWTLASLGAAACVLALLGGLVPFASRPASPPSAS